MTWDPVWEAVYQSRPWGQYPGEDVIRFVKGNFSAAEDRAKVRLLEVGSGAGANLWFMAREGFCVHGIEGSETAVRLTQQRLDRECPEWRHAGGQVQVGDMVRLPYPDGFFDAVLDVVAVCYSSFDEARRIYAELARVTKPGGKLFSRTFARGCWGEGTGTAVGPDMWVCAEGHLKGFGATRFTGESQVPELLQGWTVDRIERSSLTENGGRHEIRHLLIYGSKP
jgi:SAM-dependent methyltransferase